MSALASHRRKAATRVVAIAASLGGLAALSEMLRTLPATLPAAILVDRVLPLGDIAAELETLVGDGVPA
jgi:chemotaxis response regulator CheB